MSELLPCPLCGHLREKPSTRTKFKCRGCTRWLELSEDYSYLQDYIARKEADKAAKEIRTTAHWNGLAEHIATKEGIDFNTALRRSLAQHHKNNSDMREMERIKKLFPPDEDTPKPKAKLKAAAPKPPTYSNTTKAVVAMSTVPDDDPDSPF